jgi:hypothetical protein
MVGHLKGITVAAALRMPAVRISHDDKGVITRVYAIIPPVCMANDVIDAAFLDNFELALASYELKGQAVVSQWTYEERVYTAISVNA